MLNIALDKKSMQVRRDVLGEMKEEGMLMAN